MKQVRYHEIDRWGWECPDCGDWNEEEEYPGRAEIVTCDGCLNSYEAMED